MHPYTTKLTALRQQCWSTYARLSELRYRFNPKAIQVCTAAAEVHNALALAGELSPVAGLEQAIEVMEHQVELASGLAFHYKLAVLEQLRRVNNG